MRFTVESFELPFRWIVTDAKYDTEYLVDLQFQEGDKKIPMCACKEFHFNVLVKKPEHRDRETCVHIDFLIPYLLAKKHPMRRPQPPKFTP